MSECSVYISCVGIASSHCLKSGWIAFWRGRRAVGGEEESGYTACLRAGGTAFPNLDYSFLLMAASNTRVNWALFFLRLAVGGMAFLAGLQPILHSSIPTTLVHGIQWGLHLGEMLCGLFMILGLWMPVASLGLTLIIGWPLVVGWIHGAPILGNLHGLFLLLVALASALGGAGKWAVGRG